MVRAVRWSARSGGPGGQSDWGGFCHISPVPFPEACGLNTFDPDPGHWAAKKLLGELHTSLQFTRVLVVTIWNILKRIVDSIVINCYGNKDTRNCQVQ